MGDNGTMKGNWHKRLYREDKFCRRYCCKHHRLTRLHIDKHAGKKAWRESERLMIEESEAQHG